MRIQRTLPPAAAPIAADDICKGFHALFSGNAEVENFRAEVQNYFQTKHCFLLSSGKAALTVILRALKRICPERDEVLIPSFTCYSVPSAVVRAGLKVRLADVSPETLDYDFSGFPVHSGHDERLLAVVCPHLFGLPADIMRMRRTLNDSGAVVIEDAAQAMGTKHGDRLLGTFGDAGFFSLGRGKAFTAVEGGIIITGSKRLAAEIENCMQALNPNTAGDGFRLAAYALALSILTWPAFFWLPKAMPGLKLGETLYNPDFPIKRFSSFQAGLARGWQNRLAAFQAVRKKNVLAWQKDLARFSWLTPIPERNNSAAETPPLIRLPVMVQSTDLRDALLKASDAHGLGIMPSYPGAVNGIAGLQCVNGPDNFTGADKCAARLVTFPVHGFVTRRDRQKILACLEETGKS